MTARPASIGWFDRLRQHHRVESRILLYFLGAIVSVFLLGKAAGEVMEGDTLTFDRAILLALRTPGDLRNPIGPRWLEEAMIDMTALGGVTVLTVITVLVTAYLLVSKKPAIALFTASAVALGAAASSLLKGFFIRARPEVVDHLVGTHSTSFPSGHSMNSAIVYLTLALLLGRAQTSRAVRIYLIGVAIALTLTIGFSRLYLGVHWPTDVMAGWTVGTLWAALASLVAKSLQENRTIEKPAETRVTLKPE